VLHTTDAGTTWQVQYNGLNPIPAAIQFVDPQHGWVVGESGDAYCHNNDDPSAVASCKGTVLTTSDGGATWQLTTPTSLPITGVHFIDDNVGWALAARSCEKCTPQPVTVLRTTDGGLSWTSTPLGAPAEFSDGQLTAIDPQHAVAIIDDGTYASTDGGATWRRSPSPCDQSATWGPARTPSRLTMLDAHIGWAICADGAADGQRGSILFQTKDGGVSWTMIAQYAAPEGLLAYGIGIFPGGDGQLQFSDALHGWYVTDDRGAFVCSTSDGGHAWDCRGLDVSGFEELRLVQFIDSSHGFVSDFYGHLARTEDAGAQWSDITPPD
jgi:photosystem II stability/assembly factor-like uncharacterized protein